MISDDDQDDMMADDFSDDGFGDDLFDDEIQFEDFDTGAGGQSLSELWQNNPLVKIGIVAAGVICVIGIFVLFGGEKEEVGRSVIKAGRDVTEVPGSTEAAPEFKKAVDEVNKRRIDEAIRNQGSAIPTPTGPGDDVLKLPDEEPQEEDPLERWKRIKEERAAREAAAEEDELPATDPNAPAIEALSTAMVTQMENILESIVPIEPQSEVIADIEYLKKLREEEKEKAEEEAAERAAAAEEDEVEIVNIMIPAGEIEYGQLITRANSDTDGPVLLELVSGPLAGSRMLGTFEERYDFLVLIFDTVVVDGISYKTEAVAIDPATADVGMVTEYNGRYFKRIILPTAAAFVEGLGEAIAESGTSTTTIDGGTGTSQTTQEDLDIEQEIFAGIENAAEEAGSIIDEIAQETEPQIIVDAGTPMGVLFIEPVTDE